MAKAHEIEDLLKSCTKEERYQIFKSLRQEFSIHPIETELNTHAEVILNAIHRGSDLTAGGALAFLPSAPLPWMLLKISSVGRMLRRRAIIHRLPPEGHNRASACTGENATAGKAAAEDCPVYQQGLEFLTSSHVSCGNAANARREELADGREDPSVRV